MQKGLHRIINEIAAQRSELFHWAPVFMGIGVAVCYSFGWPIGVLLVALAILCVCAYIFWVGFADNATLPLLVIGICIGIGAGAAALRSYLVWGPSLAYPYSGVITRRVILVDRSAGDNMRLTLDQVTMGPIPYEKLPRRIRVSFAIDTVTLRPRIGDKIRAKVYVSAPQGPVEPGGFDFRQHAYFCLWGRLAMGGQDLILFIRTNR
jgi:competence protein ComEC